MGINAGLGITTGNYNIAIGPNTLRGSSMSGTHNVTMGTEAMYNTTSGHSSIGIGSYALNQMTTAQKNTAVGYEAGKATTTGSFNTCIGYNAGKAITTGQDNAFSGIAAGDACTTGGLNAGFGSHALGGLTTGNNNVAIGCEAGDTTTTGNNVVCIGRQARASAADANNEVTLGNSSIGTLRCQTQTISSLSDERDKTDIVDSEDGLDLVNLLKPRKFTWAMREESSNNGKTELGFIAQELDAALGDKNDYVHAVSKTNPDKLEASYGRLIPILVKAIQDLSGKVSALEAA